MKAGTLALVVRDAEYRKYLVCFLLLGTTTSSAVPLLSLFLSSHLHADNRTVGLFAVSTVAGAVVSLSTGWLSDRVASRTKLLRRSMVWLAAGWVLLSFTGRIWEAFAINMVFFSVLGTVSAQFFASLAETLDEKNSTARATITATIRGGYALGYVVGPLVGTAVSSAYGLRTAFVLSAGLYLCCAALSLTLTDAGRTARRTVPAKPKASLRSLPAAGLSVLLFVAGTALVLSGDGLKSVYLPLYVTGDLGGSLVTFGSLLSVSAVCEVVVMPLVGALSDRFGIHRIVTAGIAVGVVDFAILALSGQMWNLYVVQVVHVIVLSVTLGLGPTFLQQFSTLGTGTATSVFFAGQSLSRIVAGATGALGVGVLGLPGIFWVPAAFFLVVTVGLVLGGGGRGAEPVEPGDAEDMASSRASS